MFSNLGFRSQLILVISAAVILLALITSLLVSRLSTSSMRGHLVDEGKQLSIALAEKSKIALLYNSEELAEEALSDVVDTFDDIVGVLVADQHYSIIYQSGEPVSLSVVENENERVFVEDLQHFWQFITPVQIIDSEDNNTDYIKESAENASLRTIGYVSVTFSKQPLVELNYKILFYTSLVSFSLIVVLVIFLILISARLLAPIRYLAEVMLTSKKAKKIEQVPLIGPPDIKDMFSAFNEMVNMLCEREQELVAALDKAVELANLKSQFSATVSHELRTPMNGVIGMLEMLESSKLTGHDREYLNVAKFSAQSLLTLINNILDFSKYEAGKVELEEQSFDIYHLIDEVVMLLGANSRRKRVELIYELPSEFPRHMVGDSNRIRQIFINLVSNAIKFTEDGVVRIFAEEAKIGGENSDKIKPKFYVADSGIGIAKDKQNEIFNAFSQADGSTTRKFGGTGLGLSICKQLVQVMDGDIGVTSSPGEGSTFWFELTLSRDDSGGMLELCKETQLLHSQSVLCVLNSESSLQQLVMFLRSEKLQASYAMSTDSALQILEHASAKKSPIELLILDKDGQVNVEAILSRARQFYPGLRVLSYGFSSSDDFSDRNAISLAKPISLSRFSSGLSCLRSSDSPVVEEDKAFDCCSQSQLKTVAGLKVLVVDDNPVNTLVASSMLESFECAVETAVDGIDCIVKLSQDDYDIILMDCSMPKMDGYQATRTIRWMHREVKDIPIIAASAHSDEEAVQRCLDLGMNDYLVKPFNKQALLAKLSEFSASTL